MSSAVTIGSLFAGIVPAVAEWLFNKVMEVIR